MRYALALMMIAALDTWAIVARTDGIMNPTSGYIGDYQGPDNNGGTGVTPPATCSNQLDFSQACNSQYLL